METGTRGLRNEMLVGFRSPFSNLKKGIILSIGYLIIEIWVCILFIKI